MRKKKIPVLFTWNGHRFLVLFISQDAFFYSLVYDPQQKTLLADKGEIRVGNKFQADITDLLKEGTQSLHGWLINPVSKREIYCKGERCNFSHRGNLHPAVY